MSEKKKTKKKKKEPAMFIVDYDLPQKNRQCREQFYKKLKDPELKGIKKSSKSVIMSGDLEKAKNIRKKASSCGGKANLYKVKKIS